MAHYWLETEVKTSIQALELRARYTLELLQFVVMMVFQRPDLSVCNTDGADGGADQQ